VDDAVWGSSTDGGFVQFGSQTKVDGWNLTVAPAGIPEALSVAVVPVQPGMINVDVIVDLRLLLAPVGKVK
jgi:hypothetical protein